VVEQDGPGETKDVTCLSPRAWNESPPGELERLREALAEAREEVAGLRERCGRAEGQAEARAAHLASLEARLAATEAALAEARKGWLERLLEAVRRK
jgi:chromosome segregation ATPase